MDLAADLTVSAASMPTGTSRDDFVIGLQRDRRGSANLVDEAGAEHCADVAAEDLVPRGQALARRVGAKVRHECKWKDSRIGAASVLTFFACTTECRPRKTRQARRRPTR